MSRPPAGAAAPTLLLGATLVLTAVNLRAAVTSVGPVLRELQLDLGMSATLAGVLTTLPALCFGAFGLLASRLGRRIGTETALIVALLAIAAGLAIRALAPSPAWLLLVSLFALAGIGIGNVLVPVVIKAWFPDDVGRATGWYSMAISVGTALPAALTVPAAQLVGSWRGGLGVWALPALLALVPWWYLTRSRRVARPPEPGAPSAPPGASSSPAGDTGSGIAATWGPRPPTEPRPVHRQLKAWALAGFFGLQSLEAYTAMGWLPSILQDAGVAPARAGTLLGVTMVIGAPISLLLPALAARSNDQRPWVYGLIVVSATAYVGLMVAPATVPLLWAVLLGVGLGAFPLALVLIGLRAVTPGGTAALSSLTQGAGYLLAAAGPVTIGALHDRTGGWTAPLLALLVLLVPKLLVGLLAARPGVVDA